jgi:hypothetical protein
VKPGVLVGPVIGIALLLTGCGHPAPLAAGSRPALPPVPATADPRGSRSDPLPRNPPTGGDPRGLNSTQRTVDLHDADAVAVAFVVRLQLWDTRLDRRPNDAVRRAAAYATPRLRSRLLAAQPTGGAGERWGRLTEHRGWTTVSTRLGGIGESPPTTDRSAVRAVTPVCVDHGSDGWTSFPDPLGTFVVVLARAGRSRVWAVSSYTIQ